MIFPQRRWGWLSAVLCGLLVSAVCTRPLDTVAQTSQRSALPATRPVAGKQAPRTFTATPAPPTVAAPSTSPPKILSPGHGPTFSFQIRHTPGETAYLTIENEFRDGGGIQPLLSYTTTVKERRFINQRVLAPSSRPSGNNAVPVQVEWECDHYEVKEKAMKDEAEFDSLKHLYPPPSLHLLGAIPGSRVTFLQNTDGQPSNIAIHLGAAGGESGRGTPSRGIERCMLTPENMRKLLEDLGPFYWPPAPVAEGAVWGFVVSDVQRNVGAFTTQIKCTLRSIHEVQKRQIAAIDISGETTLTPEHPPSPPVVARPSSPTTQSQPATPASGPANKPREFKLERGVVSGQVEFDLTRGRLVQLTLRREQSAAAAFDGQQLGPMKFVMSTGQSLKVTVSDTPTTKPVIVGGKKPPLIPKGDLPKTTTTGPANSLRTTSRPTTTRPRTPVQRAPVAPVARPPYIPTTQPIGQRTTGKRPPRPQNAGDPELAPPRLSPSHPARQPPRTPPLPRPTSAPSVPRPTPASQPSARPSNTTSQ